jgi:hypothetical protein
MKLMEISRETMSLDRQDKNRRKMAVVDIINLIIK